MSANRLFVSAFGFILLGLNLGAHIGHEGMSEQAIVFESGDGPKPWTDAELLNDPDNFQFAIVSDRTGGMRDGVFKEAVRKLNLLQPEFVISVGDLINGYYDNEEQINREWEDFNKIIDALEMKFFTLPVITIPGALFPVRYGKSILVLDITIFFIVMFFFSFFIVKTAHLPQ